MSEATRRTILAGVAALGTELLPYARPARAATSPSAAAAEAHAQIEAAVREVHATTHAFDETIAQIEASLPQLHPDLVWRRHGRLPHSLCSIERRFNGEVVDRGLDLHGHPSARYIAAPHLIESEIVHPTYRGGQGWLRFLRRSLKNARRYRVMLARVEQPAVEAEVPMMDARWRLDSLVAELLKKASVTHEDNVVKAHAIAAYSAAGGETWRLCETGRWGALLAGEVLALSGRAV